MNKIWTKLQNKIIKALNTRKLKKNMENTDRTNYDKNSLNNEQTIYKIEDLSDSNIQQIINKELNKKLVKNCYSHYGYYARVIDCLNEYMNISCSRTYSLVSKEISPTKTLKFTFPDIYIDDTVYIDEVVSFLKDYVIVPVMYSFFNIYYPSYEKNYSYDYEELKNGGQILNIYLKLD